MEKRAMGKETLIRTSIDSMEVHANGQASHTRDLRLEILDLRQRLKQAEDLASRHAVMLREGDHRIKNSLQIVASLMTLQAARENSASIRDALNGAAARVRSVAGIHDALQGTTGADTVDLGRVLHTMCASLQDMAGDEGHISIIANVQSLRAPVALAQPIALAVNELAVNALRHAFPGRNAGAIQVSLARLDDAVCITVADNGVGLPENYAGGQGYGMKLLAMVIRQIGGDLQIANEGGTQFTIRAPLASSLAINSVWDSQSVRA